MLTHANGGPRPETGNLESVDYKGMRALKSYSLGVSSHHRCGYLHKASLPKFVQGGFEAYCRAIKEKQTKGISVKDRNLGKAKKKLLGSDIVKAYGGLGIHARTFKCKDLTPAEAGVFDMLSHG